MNLFIRLFGSLCLWICMAFILILIVLLPRDTVSHLEGTMDVMSYHFTWNKYEDNITHYFDEVITKKSLGTTLYDEPVEVELSLYFKRSIVILIPAMFLSIFIGINKGIYDYQHQSKIGRFFGKGATWLGQSVPDFFLIFLVQTLISTAMRHGLPRMDMYGDDKWYNVFFPIIFLSMYPACIISRYTSQALEEEDEQDYIKTAKAKGVPDRIVLMQHTLRNAYPKLLQHFMPIILTLFSGMFVVEFLTLYHGIGSRLITAIHIRYSIMPGQSLSIDVPAVIGFSLLLMVLLLIAQWTSQILNYYLDPVKRRNQE